MDDNDFNLVDSIMAFESGELDGLGVLELFSYLIRTGTAYTLQGFYGRHADALINDGWLDTKGEILRYPDDEPDHRHNSAPFCAKCGGTCEMPKN